MVRNLGRIDGPLLVFGGPYSNIEATRAVLAEARRLGVARLTLGRGFSGFTGRPSGGFPSDAALKSFVN